MKIIYKDGYKYQLKERYVGYISIKPRSHIDNGWISLSPEGCLLVKIGYAWDGATYFPDLKSIMRASLIHDALYQLIRDGYLDISYREEADKILKYICIEDGMLSSLASIIYRAVRSFGKPGADPSIQHPPLIAP